MRVRLVLAAACAALCASAQAQEACLGFPAALREAVSFDPRIAGAAAGRDSARANLMAAYAQNRPSVQVFGQTGFNEVRPLDQTRDDQFGVQATLDLYTFGQRRASQEAARAQLEAARHGVASARIDVAEGVALAYLDVLRGQALARLATEEQETYREDAEAAEGRLARRVITLTDASQIRARFAVARAAVTDAEAAYEAALARLSVLADQPVRCVVADSAAGTLGANAPATLALTPEGVFARAKERSFSLREARANLNAASAGVREANRANLPTISANAFALTNYGEARVFDAEGNPVFDPEAGGFVTEDTFSGDQRVGLSLRQDLYAGGRNRARRADARARLKAARSDIGLQELILEDRVRRAFAQARAAQTSGLALLEASREGRTRLDATTREYQRGTKTLTDLVFATQDYYQAASRETAARYDFYTALVRLYAAMGTLMDPVEG